MATKTRSYLAAFAGVPDRDSCIGVVDVRCVRRLTAAERADLVRDLRTSESGIVVAGEHGEIHVARWGHSDDPMARGDVRVILFRSASLSPDGAPYEWLADGPWEYAARATPQRLLQLVREHLSR